MLASRAFGAACALLVTGCTLLAGPHQTSAQPSPGAVIAAARAAARDGKLPEPLEMTDVVEAHPVSPGDWVVCVRSSAPESAIYAVHFNADSVKETRLAVRIDPCWRQAYRQLLR
jgi:hypothetical protein